LLLCAGALVAASCGDGDRGWRLRVVNDLNVPVNVEVSDVDIQRAEADTTTTEAGLHYITGDARAFPVRTLSGKDLGEIEMSDWDMLRARHGDVFTLHISKASLKRVSPADVGTTKGG